MKYCYFGLYKLHVFIPRNSHHNSKHSCFLDIYHGSNVVFSPNKQKMLIKSCFDPAKHTVTNKRLTASVISIFTTAVVLKDGDPRSRAWTTTDHRQSFCLVMFCTIFIDLMYGLSLISPVEVLMSEDVVWIGFHDGIFNQVIGFLRVLIHSLETNQNQVQVIS